MALAPVVLFAYKRKDKLEECIKALENNNEARNTLLFIFSDGAKCKTDESAVKDVREFLEQYRKKSVFKEIKVIYQSKNVGLGNSIINGVTKIIGEYDKIIVVEDDLVVARDFLVYMNQALDYYEDYEEYGSISGYTYPMPILKSYDKDVFVTRKGECWGWGTWKERWMNVDWKIVDYEKYLYDKKKRREFNKIQHGIDKMLIMQMEGKIDSWAVRWCYHLFNHNLLTVYPKKSKTINVGFDGSGTHCSASNIYDDELVVENMEYKFERLGIDKKLEKMAAGFEDKSIIKIVLDKIRRIF